MFIQHIEIKKFRSIVQQSIDITDLNIFVGNNDAGKSNILKALNLFFNGNTDTDADYNFDIDFAKHAKVVAKTAPEIRIRITFKIPSGYKGGNAIVWEKAWRKSGVVRDRIKFEGSKWDQVPQYSKLPGWLNNIKYRYVPAIKAESYFALLLTDLYEVLSLTIEQDIRKAGDSFIDVIRDSTAEISKELQKIIKLQSRLDLPGDLGELFKILDFETFQKSNSISLQQRGDGIKVRHIAPILAFIANQINKNMSSGGVRSETIWGFEEPENNLELSRAYDLAEEFQKYSKQFQIFLTTHSPAFYSIGRSADEQVGGFRFTDKRQDNVNTFLVSQNSSDQTECSIEDDSHVTAKSIDEKMGVMQMIAPHVSGAMAEIQRLKESNKQLKEGTRGPIIFVEGKDIDLYKEIIMNIPSLQDVSIYEGNKNRSGRGHNWVLDQVHSWMLVDRPGWAIGITDNDSPSDQSNGQVDLNFDVEFQQQQKRHFDQLRDRRPKRGQVFSLAVPQSLLPLFKNGLGGVPIRMEELYPFEAWRYAEKQGWLSNRKNIQLKVPHDMSLIEYLEDSYDLSDELRLIYLNEIHNKKAEWRNYVLENMESFIEEMVLNFSNTLSRIDRWIPKD